MDRILFVGAQLPREGLKGLLTGSRFAAGGGARTLGEARCLLDAGRAEDRDTQILLIYSEGPLGRGEEETLRAIRRDQPSVKVIILGDPASLSLLAQTCPTEIDGFLLNDMSVSGLTHALELVMSGQRISPPCSEAAPVGGRPAQEASISAQATAGLSPREAQILQLLVVGSSNKAMARQLAISHETVKVHMKALLRKLNARNRTQAALRGVESGDGQLSAVELREFRGHKN